MECHSGQEIDDHLLSRITKQSSLLPAAFLPTSLLPFLVGSWLVLYFSLQFYQIHMHLNMICYGLFLSLKKLNHNTMYAFMFVSHHRTAGISFMFFFVVLLWLLSFCCINMSQCILLYAYPKVYLF